MQRVLEKKANVQHDMSRLFDEIQHFRAEELPVRYDLLAETLAAGTSHYGQELQQYTDWAVKRICEMLFDDFLVGTHRPQEFFLAFSIGSILLDGDGDRRICFSDSIVKPNVDDIFCPFSAAGIKRNDGGSGESPSDLTAVSDHIKQFLIHRLPDAWFGLIANTLEHPVDFTVNAPQTELKEREIPRQGVFTRIWRLKELIGKGTIKDLPLLQHSEQFLPAHALARHLQELSSDAGISDDEPCHAAAECYIVCAYDTFVQSALCRVPENSRKLKREGYSLFRFLDIPLNWLLLGENFSMTVCYGGAHSQQARRCNGMLFLYTAEALKPIPQFALAEMAHLVLDNLVSLEDEHHAIQQGQLEGEREGIERLKSALSYLSHDYANARDMLLVIGDLNQARRVFETLLWLLKAARKYALKERYDVPSAYVSWGKGGYRGEPVTQTLMRAYDRCNESCVTISVEGDHFDTAPMDVRFIGALTELVRNIANHTRKNGFGNIVVTAGPEKGTAVIRTESGPVYDDSCAEVRGVLARHARDMAEEEWQGVLTIARFCTDLLSQPDRAPKPETWWSDGVSADGVPLMIFESPPMFFAGRTAGAEPSE